jgi:hypothetical protein
MKILFALEDSRGTISHVRKSTRAGNRLES